MHGAGVTQRTQKILHDKVNLIYDSADTILNGEMVDCLAEGIGTKLPIEAKSTTLNPYLVNTEGKLKCEKWNYKVNRRIYRKHRGCQIYKPYI